MQCGCQCTKCCKVPEGGNLTGDACSSLTMGFCDGSKGYTCLSTNTSNCGVQFSSATQAPFCEIADPSSWPPVMRVSRTENGKGMRPSYLI